MQLVATRLGDEVHEAAAGASEFGVGPLSDDHHLLDDGFCAIRMER